MSLEVLCSNNGANQRDSQRGREEKECARQQSPAGSHWEGAEGGMQETNIKRKTKTPPKALLFIQPRPASVDSTPTLLALFLGISSYSGNEELSDIGFNN